MSIKIGKKIAEWTEDIDQEVQYRKEVWEEQGITYTTEDEIRQDIYDDSVYSELAWEDMLETWPLSLV